MQLLVSLFFNFTITFDSDTLKTPTVPHLKYFFQNKQVCFYKESQFLHLISMLKSGECEELHLTFHEF